MRRPLAAIASSVLFVASCGGVSGDAADAGARGDGHIGDDGPPDPPDAPLEAPTNYAFVTHDAHVLGALGGVAGADRLCQAAADAGDPRLHGRTYRAWLSDSTGDAIDRLGTANGWRRLDGAIVARSAADLARADGVLTPPRLDETGLDLTGVIGAPYSFPTGSRRDGRSSGATCADWTTTEGRGSSWRIDEAWHDRYSGDLGCGDAEGLLCLGVDFSDPLDAPPPPPAGAPVIFIATVPAGSPVTFDGFDQLCATQARVAGLAGSHRAALATTRVAPPARVSPPAGPWYRPDGVVAVREPDLFVAGDFPDTPILFGASGAAAPESVLTGAPRWGSPATSATNCDDYTFINPASSLYFGQAFRSAAPFSFAVGYGCTPSGLPAAELGVYCLPTLDP